MPLEAVAASCEDMNRDTLYKWIERKRNLSGVAMGRQGEVGCRGGKSAASGNSGRRR